MEPIIDHIQITVKNLDEAEQFYDQLMPILGFDLSKKSKGRVAAHDFDVIEYCHDNLIVGINSPRKAFEEEEVHRRKPGALHHLAFKASSEEEVDTAYQQLLNTSTNIVAPPQLYPQHGEHYYALFIKDPGGIKLEIVFEKK
ncbi:MAG: VOC family protein [bacterium]|nr:VOC family protein [bacterium]